MTEESEKGDPFDKLRSEVPDFHGYDEYALDQYQANSFYFHERAIAKKSLAVAAQNTCERFGHDAPRGKCIRCGLGVDLIAEDDSDKRKRERVAERDAWLAARRR